MLRVGADALQSRTLRYAAERADVMQRCSVLKSAGRAVYEWIFGKRTMPIDEYDESVLREWYEKKTAMMEAILGKEHNACMHAIIPYGVGGGLDLYYYPNGIKGTGIATKELCEAPDEGSTNDRFELYELVMFTQHAVSLEQADDESTPFGSANSNINAILNVVARFSAEAKLNPLETAEFPPDMEIVGGKCFIFDAYGESGESRSPFGLMLVIEVFRSEMEFARSCGGRELLTKLKMNGHYPYSDLERRPVV